MDSLFNSLDVARLWLQRGKRGGVFRIFSGCYSNATPNFL